MNLTSTSAPDTLVTIPLKYPSSTDVEPAPATTVFGGTAWVTPTPTVKVLTPTVNVWSD